MATAPTMNSPRMKVFGRSVRVPASRYGRIGLGVALILGGLLGFLPVLGFWMIPLGLIVLSVDSAPVRRFRRRMEVRFGRRRRRGAGADEALRKDA